MKRLAVIICVLFSGSVSAWTVHSEDPNIVGGVYERYAVIHVCFDNDGWIPDGGVCELSQREEGYAEIEDDMWRGSWDVPIFGCGIAPVNPVTSAFCQLVGDYFAGCVPNTYVLVKTIVSGHYWTIHVGESCENWTEVYVVPCLKTDAFNPIDGCYNPNPPEFSVKGGFIRTDSNTAPPLDVHCDDPTHVGRMTVDGVNNIIYVCTPTGWSIH